jgi:hypothetical protein
MPEHVRMYRCQPRARSGRQSRLRNADGQFWICAVAEVILDEPQIVAFVGEGAVSVEKAEAALNGPMTEMTTAYALGAQAVKEQIARAIDELRRSAL